MKRPISKTVYLDGYVVYHCALGLYQHGHVQENLVQLQQAGLELVNCLLPFPDLSEGIQSLRILIDKPEGYNRDLPSALGDQCILKDVLCLSRVDYFVDPFLGGVLPSHRVQPPPDYLSYTALKTLFPLGRYTCIRH